MKRILAPLLVLLAVAAPLGAQTGAATRAYRDTAAGYTVHVPAAWRRLPQGIVDRIAAQVSSRIDEEMPPAIGFEAKPGANGVRPVLVTILAMRDANVREASFAEEITSTAGREELGEAVDQAVAPGRPRLVLGRIQWDAEAGVGWVAASGGAGSSGAERRFLTANRPVERWGVMVVAILASDGSSYEQLRERVLPVVRAITIHDRPAAP